MKKAIKSKLNSMSKEALRLVLSDCLELNAGSSCDKRVLKAIANYVRSRVICSSHVVLHDNDIVAVCNFWHDIAIFDRDIVRIK